MAALLLVIAIAVGLTHRPSQALRASDLRGLLRTMTADIQSCAGGVGESQTAQRAIDTGASRDTATAISIATTGAANCSPANNELVDDLVNYQVPQSLDAYHLQAAVTGLISWAAPDAEDVMQDIASSIAARGMPAEAADLAAQQRALQRLDKQRAAVDASLRAAIRSLSAQASVPALPG